MQGQFGESKMRPPFAVVEQGYPRMKDFPIAKLYESIGWKGLIEQPQWRNTCATRMCIALAHAGVMVAPAFQLIVAAASARLAAPSAGCPDSRG